jgi:cystathionine beta-lyase/cystathionine gamma-synthase
VSAEARAEMGVSEGMLRINVGLEDPDDVIDDLDQALARAGL